MIRTLIAILGAVLMLASVAVAGDDSVRFEVRRPSAIVVESTPTGGFRITVEPLGDDGAPPLPAPPKPNPDDEPDMPQPDMIGTALSQLPEAERRNVALLFDARALVAQSSIDAFATTDQCASWLLTGVMSQVDDAFQSRYTDQLAMIAHALGEQPGRSLGAKLEAYRARLAGEIEGRQ